MMTDKRHISNREYMARLLSCHLRCILTLLFFIGHFSWSVAQIKIGGNVYGGGNAGDMTGSTNVTVCAGDINAVFGGARMADVGGSAFVNIDGEHMSNDIIINVVYGGNDIAGKVGQSVQTTDAIPEELKHAVTNQITETEGKNTKQYGAFVLTTKEKEADTGETQHHMFIGQLYGGGNGNYEYSAKKDNDKYDVTLNNVTIEDVEKPELGKTYLEIRGGTIAYLFGGGNCATVTDATDICIDNESSVTTSIKDANGTDILNDEAGTRLKLMGLNTTQLHANSSSFQFSHVFGGNNVAEMAIRPTWHLKRGWIRDLYSGGNAGDMTYYDNGKGGILLAINSNNMHIDNVYGGCRIADVNPNRNTLLAENITVGGTSYSFPANYAARVLVLAGDINNVYGGNDISGNVYGGNAIGIHSSIKGDVYGGGNGSYAYTDNIDLKELDEYKDFYYDPGSSSSVDALNAFRPNAEAVSIHVVGTESKKTVIGGAIYCGGNSATLRNDDPNKRATSQLKIGSYVIADNVFLGNNGANMVKTNEKDEANGIPEGVLRTLRSTVTGSTKQYNSMNLKDKDQFDKYMDGCAMMIDPDVTFDPDYVPYSTYFGSFYCGGNVGSMKRNGAFNVSFNDKVVIYNKVVGGSNEANVYQSDYNTQYLGGLLGDPEEGTGNKLVLNFGGLKIQPKRWKITRDASYAPILDANGNEQYELDDNGNRILEWNTVDGRTFDTTTKKYTPMASVAPTEGNANVEPYDASTDLHRRFHGGNIYGGCYSNGHVNGNVVINLNASLVDRKGENAIFDEIEENEGEAKLYDGNYNIKKRYTGVLLGEQGMDVLGRALNVFGGGYGGDSEIWGSATINLNAGYTFQIFGGGEQGAIGRAVSHQENATNPNIHDLTYEPNEAYSTYINLRGSNEGVYRGHTDDQDDMAEAEFIYGGSFEGLIAGSTHINLGNGRIFNSFAGSCNADILGHTETYIGRQANNDGTYTDGGGFPWIRDHVYGGNDLGGHIFGLTNFKDRVSSNDILGKVYNPKNKQVGENDSNPNPDVTNASAYMEYQQGRVENIYGGCYGVYDYKDDHFRAYTDVNGIAKTGFTKPRMVSAFVNFRPLNHTRNAVDRIYGGGQGYSGDSDRDMMQDRSYVLIDIPQNITKYQSMEVFGAGDFCGLGMRNEAATTRTVNNETVEVMPALNPEIAAANADGVTASAVLDLVRGQIGAAYGASCNEGVTRRTIVNVPEESTIQIGSIFGGAYGSDAYKPCDVYEAKVNWLTQSEDAYLISNPATTLTKGAIYGGNNYARRTLYGQINIEAPVKQKHHQYGMTTATIYGAGCGSQTWNEYTEVNLKDGAKVWEVYGGGEAGGVMSAESVQAYINGFKPDYWPKEKDTDPDVAFTETDWLNAWSLGGGYDPVMGNKTPLQALKEGYLTNTYTNLANPLVRTAEMDDRDNKTYKYNTNVIINKGAYVGNYAYGGGLGSEDDKFVGSGDVYGTTYIALLGGIVNKDLYAAGTSGAVYNLFGAENLTASANAFIAGGSARNVYGGGWKGSVGHHQGEISASSEGDVLGETHVVIGIRPDQPEANLVNELKKVLGEDATKDDYGLYAGQPAIQRNAYGGGEGGSIIGHANLTLNNGYIGYVYNTETGEYEEKLNDETWTDHVGEDRLSDCGNLFGGGYDDNSSVDESSVKMYGGVVRNSIFGGGEIATIGRGATQESGVDNKDRTIKAIYKAGGTHIEMYNGHVKHNVFGGGKGYNILGYGGTRGFYTDGYVFGKTEVYIHGGEIGTDEGLKEGYGNVFGGGDVGFVYGTGYFSDQTKNGKAQNPGGSTGSPNHWYYYDTEGMLTEDCKVVISPYLQIKANGNSVTYPTTGNGQKTYGPYDYVPTEYLNTLPADKTDAGWTNLYTGNQTDDDMTERGIHIHNAVFGGGNVSSNSESYNNATTVFGNATATLYDVFHHDFITVGTEHTGGLYGGGNLSLVGGYRELNITNYGTDYYGLDQQISLEKYRTLTNRERAYFKLEYVCQVENSGHQVGKRISEDEYNSLSSSYKNETYWKQYGFCSIYAGRLLNTIQRADFCGVFGSRLVLQGAKDRVADVADATEYTINRVSEVSLNQQRFTPGDDSSIHGNYFGIYSGVNYLGNLTSDVHFTDNRRYVEGEDTYESTTSYYDWKIDHLEKRDRNNGTAYNQVALASGVFLELTTEYSTPSKKVYGDITGVVELDLISVKKNVEEGGGYVYARNEHGLRTEVASYENLLLSEYNQKDGDKARTKKMYTYSTSNLLNHQTSGNFIHKSKRIIDDCYPNNGVYQDLYVTSPAHYWYIKGDVYIYDQVVSAYAGSAAAYSKEVQIPLTISAGSNGRLKLLNVQPNLYAYYSNEERTDKIGSDGVKVDNERTTFYLNDVITWWDWNQLAQNEQKYFVKETYVNVDPCTIDGISYEAGAYVLENDSTYLAANEKTAWKTFQTESHVVKNSMGNDVTDLTNLFRSSNNISHGTGYVLTLDMNSPKDWDDWYSPILQSNGGKISKETYKLPATTQANYILGPTYRLTGESGLYGQRRYEVGEIITKEVYDDYKTTVGDMSFDDQADAEPAYVALANSGNIQAGSAIGETAYNALSDKSNFQSAWICVNSIQLGDEEYVLMGELVSGTDANLDALADKYMEYNNGKINADQISKTQALEYIEDHLSPAYYIKEPGLYGGQYFQSGKNYGAIKSWCSLTDDRNKFDFNYDAFDVLVDSIYPGEGHTDVYGHPYDEVQPVEYRAFYHGMGTLAYYDNDGTSHTISSGESISRLDYEKVRNDQMHYTRIAVDAKSGTGSETQTVYIVNETIINKGTPYAKGQDISEKDYNNLTDENKSKVDEVTFTKGNVAAVHYYCYEDYTPLASSEFTPEIGEKGKKGSIISTAVFTDETSVPNYQKKFTIQGSEPTETTTLYVSRESNAKDVTSEKVISVVYQYTYYEPDDEGDGVTMVNELHVLNIHLQLESGAPEIGPLAAPPAVIPGNTVGVKAPTVNPGLYEVLTSGWELFDNEDDAQLHRNGTPFINNGTPLYWYQNQKVFLAFYSKTYLGKTYSNYVPLSVANYHDLDAIMKDKEHHLYVDHPNVMRNSKIYIDNRDCESDDTKSELDLLKDFFDLSVGSSSAAVEGHAPLDSHVQGGDDLEFILNSDVSPKAYTDWTPIGNGTQCFKGNFHGDGYTISGLNNSLFGKLCGNVYNLGVTGSFTGAGVADSGEGYVENCWIHTTGTPATGVKAVFNGGDDGSQMDGDRKLLVNCYYPETNAYTAGMATKMTEREFYNGTVAYNLNGFYLNKRYYNKKQTSGIEYKYLTEVDGTLSEDLITGYYPNSYAFYPLDDKKKEDYGNYGYVEDRYADGDFRYAAGEIPESMETRMRTITTENTTTPVFAPIWPDDYLYFGQNLNYGWSDVHQNEPGHITGANRVYRAPAYFRNSEMSVAHFNSNAFIVAHSKPKTVTDTNWKMAYPDMTAIDFAGYNDALNGVSSYEHGKQLSGKFYPPLLDDDGLTDITIDGETKNLLVYAPSADANQATYDVLSEYFAEPVFDDYYDESNYHRVEKAIASSVIGHLVESGQTATNDHLLVDMEEFYCPIEYSFTGGKRMWYQRQPDNYVDIDWSGTTRTTKGWEAISLPFTAELVTTQQKGEITHFYEGSTTGHEYWLREYTGGSPDPDDNKIFVAKFNKLEAVGSEAKSDGNTFLWDYYYSNQLRRDANTDLYQEYYKTTRTYNNYPYIEAGTPYIVGFPGSRYYEFDLSGEFEPEHTYAAIDKLDKQIITFVSEPNTTINVSDDEMTGVTKDNYTFMPNYLKETLESVTGTSTLPSDYYLNSTGDAYVDEGEGNIIVLPFRPYFETATSNGNGAKKRNAVRRIIFDQDENSFEFEENDPRQGEVGGELRFYTQKLLVGVESSLRNATDVLIVNTSGQTIASFIIQPGETIETPIPTTGVYIIRAMGGKYNRKVTVK